jgi:hypothetical protein
LRAVAVMFAELGGRLAADDSTSVFDALTRTATMRVCGATAASITTYRGGVFTTVSATDEKARQADALQYELGTGPCVDAILHETLYFPADLAHDARWPEYGARASTELGWSSMLSYRLSSHLMPDEVIAGLNIYAKHHAAFDDTAVHTGLLLATHGALAVAAQSSAERAGHLEHALRSNREIGVAMGILMAQHHVTRDQAFDLLRIASQHSNRKLNQIALEVGDTGTLALGPPTQPTQPTS